MNKFDRYIFIFIGLGIWAFVITQFIRPISLNAHDDGHEHFDHIRLTVDDMCYADTNSGDISCF